MPLLILRGALIFFLLFPFIVQADDLGPTPSVRALGMGNAYTGVVDNIEALLYNPASLAKVRGVQLHIASAEVSGDSTTGYKELQNIENSSNLEQTLPSLYGNTYNYGAGALTGLAMPMFGVAVYNYANATVSVADPPLTQLNASILDDYAYAIGFGVPIGPYVQFGIEGRQIKRTGTEQIFGVGDFASLSASQLKSQIYNWGIGYELDSGMNFIIPTPIFTGDISVVWQNIGETTFKGGAGNNIPANPQNLTVGLAGELRLPLLTIRPAVDYRYITDNNIQLFQKFNFGVEIGLPVVDIRGGFSEGYYCYGAGVGLGPIRVDAASYGVELGAYPGQLEDRRYMLQVSIELDVGNFGVNQDQGGKGSKSGAGGGGQDSFWGDSDSLKQRR